MQVSVRLSAALAQITGAPRMNVEVGDGATVGDLVRALEERYPGLAPRLRHAVPIVAGNHASLHDTLSGDPEVAFLMPVAGGAIG